MWVHSCDNGTLESQTSYTDSSIGEEADATSNTVSGDDIVEFATRATWKALFLQNFDPWKFRPRDWQEPSPVSADALYLSRINLGLLGTDPANIARPLAGEVDESYSLSVTQQGVATISANTSIGLSRSLTTFTQLFYAHSDQQNVYTPLAPVSIFDAPRFAHRGLNLDVSRSYYPVSDIKRQISACAYTKMNRFHLHATDSQAWPLEIPSLPSVSERGAYRPHLVYSKDDFAHLQRYAALQGVEMITEIDMPGHTSSIAYSFPELIAAFNMQPDWTVYANDPPSGTLKLNSPAVRTFIQTLFNGVLPRVQPFSSYFHTGGDEVNVNAYLLDETVKSNDSAVLTPLMQAFIDHAHGLIRAQGLAPIVWEEMLLKWKLNLASDVVVQAWRSSKSVADIVATGHKVIAGNYDFWYLSCGTGQYINYAPSVSARYWPFTDYCAPFKNWRVIYSYDPLAGVPSAQQHLVIGGEAHMWSQQVDPMNVDQMVWPRAAAAAEVLWSGAKDEHGRNRSYFDAAPRLSEMRERLVARGVRATVIQIPYCTRDGIVCQRGYDGMGDE